MSKEIVRSGDYYQYPSEPMPLAARKGPVVTLINAMPDPLGSLAAICAMYRGRVVRSLDEVNDAERTDAFRDMLKTVLNGALEVGLFHFLIEGVSRDFTHQAVRNRFSFEAQESLRLAVKKNWPEEIAVPLEIQTDSRQLIWEQVLGTIEEGYEQLVNDGTPAEVARKLLPHAVTTRYHWVVDLRNLLQEAGKRTCTQAQFEWRLVFAQIAKALREYAYKLKDSRFPTGHPDFWQFEFIANQLRPNCYQTGSCGFMAEFDRGCTIRERVEFRSKAGARDFHDGLSEQWRKPLIMDVVEYDEVTGRPFTKLVTSPGIDPSEWAADPGAARATTPIPTSVPVPPPAQPENIRWAPIDIARNLELRRCNTPEAHGEHGWGETAGKMTRGYFCEGRKFPGRPIRDNPQA